VPLRTRIDLGDGWRLEPQKVRDVQWISVSPRPRRSARRHRRVRAAAGLDHLLLLRPGPACTCASTTPASTARASVVAATTVKGYDVFESEFGRLVVALKASGNYESSLGRNPDRHRVGRLHAGRARRW
jgi:hypothetical protein